MSSSNGVRVDTGIQMGQDVGVYYDPMICKLITHDISREKALNKLISSLQRYRIAGVPTNIDFLIRCAQHKTFRTAGAVNTGFLDDHMADVLPTEESTSSSELAIAIGTFASLLQLEGRVGINNLEVERRMQFSPWNSLSGSWRNGRNLQHILYLTDGTSVECTALRDGSYEIRVTAASEEEGEGEEEGEDEERKDTIGTTFHVNGTLSSDQQMEVVINGSQRIALTVALREVDERFQVCMWPQSLSLLNDGHYFWEVSVKNPRIPTSSRNDVGASSGQGIIAAPMPGKI